MYSYSRPDEALDIASIEAQAHALRSRTIARFGSDLGRVITKYVGGVFASISEARRMEAQYRELSALSDRELRDMGISRGDIPAVVAGVFTREPVTTITTLEPKAAPEAVDEDVRIAA